MNETTLISPQAYLKEYHKRQRLKRTKGNFWEFCQTYFGRFFYKDPSQYHLQMFDEIQEMIDSPEPHSIAWAWPRGFAKSTITTLALPIYVAVHAYKHYIVIVSDTVDQSTDFLTNIRNEFEDNELLRYDYGDLTGDVWTTQNLILKNDVRIQAFGVGKKIRGRRHRQWRPDLILCDDIENDENVVNPEQRKKTLDWFTKALSKAGDERTDKIVVGTLIHYDSLLNKLINNPTYKTKVGKSIIKWSTSDKWEVWEGIITNLDNPNHIEDAKKYFEDNRQEMLEGTEVIWEEREDYYNLMLQYIAEGPAAFSSEKQNEPLSDEDRIFLPEWITYYEDEELVGKELFIVGFVDPSMGKKKSDFSAIVILGMDANKQIYVLEADLDRRHPDTIISDVVEYHRKHIIKAFGVEENQFQEYFKDNLKKEIEEMGRYEKINVHIKGVRQFSDKHLRIQSLQPDIKNGRIKFKREHKQLIEQIVNFPSAAHDDGPDALEGARSMFGKNVVMTEYYKQLAHESIKPTIQSILQNPSLQGLIQ